ncbi:uncharacterized protein [Haliotis asinina]|uniref:uncharacterized protein n=1 Tax=Haliotis asinina TaxID=109174 RepID=UPI003532064D
MVVFTGLPWLLLFAFLICFCNCQDSLVSVIRKLDRFEEELLDNKADMLRIEKRVLNTIDVAKASLRAELKENIREQVREAMAEILQRDSLQDMVKGEVVSELRHLKQGYRQMERQIHHVARSLKEILNETDIFHESIMKKVDGEDSSDVCVREKQDLELVLQKCDAYNVDLKADNERLVRLNEKYQSQVSRLKRTVAVLSSSQTPQPGSTGSTTSVTRSTPYVTTPSPSVFTTSVTTPKPPVPSLPTTFRSQGESRILIAPLESNANLYFHQLSIPSNTLSTYKYHALNWVTALAYIAKTNELLIGLYNPNKILSSTLDTSNVRVLMEGVYTTGMAVDEGRDIIFMSTFQPRYSVSRMSTVGGNLTFIVDLHGFGGIPRQITLDTRRKMIYGCNEGKLFTVTYSGHGLATLVRGTNMHAVTLDQTAGVLYYNHEKKLMKMNLSNNRKSEVTTLNVLPWHMELHSGTIYISGLYPSSIDVVSYTGEYTLQSIELNVFSQVTMCVIP